MQLQTEKCSSLNFLAENDQRGPNFCILFYLLSEIGNTLQIYLQIDKRLLQKEVKMLQNTKW